MPYITKANFRRILKTIRLSEIGDISGEVYKMPIYFLSSWEVKYLLTMQALLKNPEHFAIEVYKPIENIDTFQYVYESDQPSSYHTDINCEKLNSGFKNFEIPFEIIERANKQGGEELAKSQVHKFRNWFLKYNKLFVDEPENFLKKLDIDWNVQRSLKEVTKNNSGIKDFDNYNMEQLETEIDKIISDAGNYFMSNPDKQDIIRRFQKLTFLAYKPEAIAINNTRLNDKELKMFLKDYDEQFKKPIKYLLIEYYRVKYNPDLSFEGKILEKLNFRQCSYCQNNNPPKYVTDYNTNNEIDDLPY